MEPNQSKDTRLAFDTGEAGGLVRSSVGAAAEFDPSWRSALESIGAEDGSREDVEPKLPAIIEIAPVSDPGLLSVRRSTAMREEAALASNPGLANPSIPRLLLNSFSKPSEIHQRLHPDAFSRMKTKAFPDAPQSDRCPGEHASKVVSGHQTQSGGLDTLIPSFPLVSKNSDSPSPLEFAPSPTIEGRDDAPARRPAGPIPERAELSQSTILSVTEIVASAGTGRPQGAVSVEKAGLSFKASQALAEQSGIASATNAQPLFRAQADSSGSGELGSAQNLHHSSAPESSTSQPANSIAASFGSKQQVEDARESSGKRINSIAVTESRSTAENTGRAATGRESGQDVSSLRHSAVHPELTQVRAESPTRRSTPVQLDPGATPGIPVAVNRLMSTATAEHRTDPGPGQGSSLERTLAAMDGTNESPAAHWLQAGARRAEAGFEDPVLGWIGVRAQLDSNGVHAALVPGSGAAAESLETHLTGLNAYLVEHHAPVESLRLELPEHRFAEQGTQPGFSHGDQQAPGNRYGNGAETASDQLTYADSTDSSDVAPVTVIPVLPQVFISSESRYISIVA